MIIFSAFIPKMDDLYILHDFFLLVNNNLKDHKIYIGIQQNSCPMAEGVCDSYRQVYNLNISYSRINSETYLDSDVPGFQTALSLYYNDNQRDDTNLVYFGHTKGVTTGNITMRNFLFSNVFLNKTKLDFLLDNEEYGSFGYWLSPINSKVPYSNILKKWNMQLKYPVLNYFYTNTFYVTKRTLLDNFLKDINPSFFVSNLEDRYFFERDFIHFVDMQGYKPLYSEIVSNNGWRETPGTGVDYNISLTEWEKTL